MTIDEVREDVERELAKREMEVQEYMARGLSRSSAEIYVRHGILLDLLKENVDKVEAFYQEHPEFRSKAP